MYHIAVLGTGGIGLRHLQALDMLGEEYSLYAMDVNAETLEMLRGQNWKHPIVLVNSISALPKSMDFCTIATTSGVRRMVFDQLIAHSDVRYVLFEKVLFQTEADYYDVRSALNERQIKAWVNCTRREMPIYRRLRKELQGSNRFAFSATGTKWGLCCNGIHMLDLVQYLTGSSELELNGELLSGPIEGSKRKGFFETYGSLTGRTDKCSQFSLTCMNGTEPSSIMITLDSDNERVLIDEAGGFAFTAKRSENWRWKKIEFPLLLTSQIMGTIVEKIIQTGTCDLAGYEESMKLHLKYIACFKRFFNENGMEVEKCPIT